MSIVSVLKYQDTAETAQIITVDCVDHWCETANNMKMLQHIILHCFFFAFHKRRPHKIEK